MPGVRVCITSSVSLVRAGVLGFAASALSQLSVKAQSPLEFSGWAIEPRASAILAVSPGRDGSQDREAETVTAELGLDLLIERVLDNGAEIGVWLGGRAQRDHSARNGFSGQIGPIDPFRLDFAPRGAFTGLTSGGVPDDQSVRAQLETAFVYIDGGYGQVLFGRDVGIARRFHEGSPSVFSLHTITNARLDTSGIATVLTRNDLTGPSAKLSYASPRLLGLRVGASYTPRANVSGLDRDPDRDVTGIAEPRLEQGLEAALNFSHRFRQTGLRLETYGAYGRAAVEFSPLEAEAGTVEVWSTGGQIEWKNIEFGVDWLTTDNVAGRYTAWSIGAQSRLLDLDWSAEYGRSFDELTGVDGSAWSFGVSYEILKRLTIATGLQGQILQNEALTDRSSTGPVIEMTLRY